MKNKDKPVLQINLQILVNAWKSIVLILISSATCAFVYSAEQNSQPKLEPWQQAQKTEVWKPVPKVIDAQTDKMPSDAIALFNGGDLSLWEPVNEGASLWKVGKGIFTVEPGTGDIRTKKEFCDIQLHIEWRSPLETKGLEGQQRGNSGVFFQERYEVQILDSFDNETYSNGQAASVYKQHIPLVNAMRKPGKWNVYDIIFTSPRFDSKGDVTRKAAITVLHNGVLVQNHVQLSGPTQWIGVAEYQAHGCAPLRLQDHGNPVSFKNIWVREL